MDIPNKQASLLSNEYTRKTLKENTLEKRGINLKIPDSKVMNEVGYLTGTNVKVQTDFYNQRGSLTTEEGVQIVLEEFSKESLRLPISADKILTASLAELIRTNDSESVLKGKESTYEVNISLQEYALACGKDVIERPKDNPQARAKEKKRVQRQLEKFKNTIKNDLIILKGMSLDWSEKIKGKPRDFKGRSIVIGYDITGGKSGNIKVQFHPEMVKYIAELPITQYPKQLLSIDGRNDNAYKIGKKLSNNFYMDCNRTQIKNPNKYRILKVKTLLKVTSLPSLEEASKSSGWVVRIKEPLEEALDELYRNGTLINWKYSGVKGAELPDYEATTFRSFSEWANTNVFYDMNDEEEDEQRRREKLEKARNNPKINKNKKGKELTGAEKLQARINGN